MHTQEHNDYVEGLHQKLSKDQGNKSMDIEQVCKLLVTTAILCENSSCQKLSGLNFVVECTNRLSRCAHASVSLIHI